MGEGEREQTKRTQGRGRSWNLPLHNGALKKVNDIDDVATTGSRKLELGFHQKERDKTTIIELGAYIIDASKKGNWRRRASLSIAQTGLCMAFS
jgi:hypothetical protein